MDVSSSSLYRSRSSAGVGLDSEYSWSLLLIFSSSLLYADFANEDIELLVLDVSRLTTTMPSSRM